MRFNKDFTVGLPGDKLTFFVEVDNLFNRHNVLDVYTRTGLPDNDLNVSGADLALNEEELNQYDHLFDHDPQNYSPPRTIRTGLEFNF
jgi:outer membrane receptor protein involved in Fe transport